MTESFFSKASRCAEGEVVYRLVQGSSEAISYACNICIHHTHEYDGYAAGYSSWWPPRKGEDAKRIFARKLTRYLSPCRAAKSQLT